MGNLCSDERSRLGSPWSPIVDGLVRRCVAIYNEHALRTFKGSDADKALISKNQAVVDENRARWKSELDDLMGEVFDLESREVQLFDAKDLSAAARTVIEAMRRVTLMIAEVLLRQHLVRIRQDDYNSDELNANLPVLTNSLTKHFEGVQKQFPRHIDNVIAAIDSDNDKKLDANELRTQFVPRVAQYAHTLKVDNLTGASGATGQKSTASGSAPSSTGPTPATTPSPAPGATSKPDATATTGAAAAATTAAAAPAANGVGLTA